MISMSATADRKFNSQNTSKSNRKQKKISQDTDIHTYIHTGTDTRIQTHGNAKIDMETRIQKHGNVKIDTDTQTDRQKHRNTDRNTNRRTQT